MNTRMMVVEGLMLLLMTLTLLSPISAYKCEFASGSDGCEFRDNIYVLKYQSTYVKISDNDTSVKIDCKFSTTSNIYYANMTNLKIGNVHKLVIQHCPLPDTSLKQAMENMGINQFKELDIRIPVYGKVKTLDRKMLQNLVDVTKLVLSYFRTLREPVFEDMKNLTWLEIIDYESFHKFPETLFKPLTNLKHLVLRTGMRLVPGMFKSLTRLEHLSVSFNNHYINRTVFSGLQNLKSLELFTKNIGRVDSRPLGLKPEFTILDLINYRLNTLGQFDSRLLTEMPNLKNLSLFADEIVFPSYNFLLNLTHLENINIKASNYHGLPLSFPKCFENHFKLKNVSLTGCNVRSLRNNAFKGSTNILTIDLSNNDLAVVPKQTFDDVKAVQHIDLSENNIKELPIGLFFKTKHLKTLKLFKNKLKHIKDLFLNPNSLEFLDMSFNSIEKIDGEPFSALTNLKTFNISSNNLTSLEYEFDIRYSVLENCTLLEDLQLENNSLTLIYEDWRVYLTKLNRLNLANNGFVTIDIHSLNFTSGVTIDLSNNKIEIVNFTQYSSFGVEENSVSNGEHGIQTKTLIMKNNPLVCNCTLLDFILFVKGNRSELNQHFYVDGNILKCQEPVKLGNVQLKFLPLDRLECFSCPTQCQCDFDPRMKAYKINCKIVSFKQAPESVTLFQYGSDHAELRLEGYQMYSFKLPQSPGYNNITHFYLANNSINDIDFSGFSRDLKVLDLSDNLMTSLSEQSVKFLREAEHLINLSLHNNKWECNCKSSNLVSMINELRAKENNVLMHPYNVTCGSTGTPLIHMKESDLCPAEITAEIIVTFTVATFIIVMLSVSVFYYKYKKEIQIYCYSSRWKFVRWMVTHPDLDENKIYDAFVSYANEDEEFVMQHLVPELEESGEPKFKLCIHYRDWIGGEMIQTQIVNSVLSSRRTIVVLSPNFLQSVWGPLEFRTAHAEALREGISKVIVILYKNVGDEDKLDKELKTYLQMNTFVKWGSPWFWEQLKYALPHPPKKTDRNFKLTCGCFSKKNKGQQANNMMNRAQIKGGELLYVPESGNRTNEPYFEENNVTVHKSASIDSAAEDANEQSRPAKSPKEESEHGFEENNVSVHKSASIGSVAKMFHENSKPAKLPKEESGFGIRGNNQTTQYTDTND